MTRGRPPRQATREAAETARKRGVVHELPGGRSAFADLMIFCPAKTVFVRVKRTRSHISGIADITEKYPAEINRLRTIPQTRAVIRELWVRSPRGSWQYFRVADEAIIEIRSDGTALLEPGQEMKPGFPAGQEREDQVQESGVGTGFICPYFLKMTGVTAP